MSQAEPRTTTVDDPRTAPGIALGFEIEPVRDDPAHQALVARGNAEIERWRRPEAAVPRLGEPQSWSRVRRLVGKVDVLDDSQLRWPHDAIRRPVLYAALPSVVADGNGIMWRADVLVSVFGNGHARYVARRHTRLGSKVGPVRTGEVADLGGVPLHPELVLATTYRGIVLVDHRVSAPEGSPAADTIAALNLLATCGLWEAPRVTGIDVAPYKVPAATQVAAPTREPRNPDTRPRPRMVRDAREAEELAAEWVRWLGWVDARTTPVGADRGIDVIGSDVVAQVKFEAVKTGRPTLQALYGAGIAHGARQFLFFSSAGYTEQASDWTNGLGIALFRFTLDGSIEPANEDARRLFDER